MRVEILKPVPYSGAVVRSGVLDVSPAVGAHWIATGAGREAIETLAEGTGSAPSRELEGEAAVTQTPGLASELAAPSDSPSDPPPAPEAAPLEGDDDEDAIHIPQPSFSRAPVHNRKGARR